MITLYGKVRSRAARCLWALEEAGAPYRHVPTDYATGDNRTPDYLALNPNGTLPTLVDDGFVVWESVAINLYIARKYGGPLWPRTVEGEGLTWQWSLWGVLEIERRLDVLIAETLFRDEATRDRAAMARAREGLEKPLAILASTLAGTDHMVEGRFTIADLTMTAILDSGAYCGFSYERYPAVASFLDRFRSRPACRKVAAMAG